MTDLYMALQKNTIDGIILNYNVHAIFKLHEQLKYTTLPATGSVSSAFIMNKRAFAKLPPEAQAFIEGEARLKYTVKFGQSWDGICAVGRDMFLKSGGKEFQWLPEAVKRREELESPMWETWIADKEKRGLPGRKAVDEFYYILKGLKVSPTAIGYEP